MSDHHSIDLNRVTRRDFLLGAGVVAGAAAAGPWLSSGTAGAEAALAVAPATAEDRWLGPDFWANRLQDWMLLNGKITCVAAGADRGGRTASVLTRSLTGGNFRLLMRMGTQVLGTGFSGFLVGVGEPDTDYRRAALVGAASGEAGGMLCVYGSDGRVAFREHTDELRQFDYAVIPSTASGPAPARKQGELVEFSLDGVAEPGGTLELTLKAVDAKTRAVLSQAVLTGRSAGSVAGGFALVSSGPTATYWFRNLRFSGRGVQSHPERGLGPIVGTLFSVAGEERDGNLQRTGRRCQRHDRCPEEPCRHCRSSRSVVQRDQPRRHTRPGLQSRARHSVHGHPHRGGLGYSGCGGYSARDNRVDISHRASTEGECQNASHRCQRREPDSQCHGDLR